MVCVSLAHTQGPAVAHINCVYSKLAQLISVTALQTGCVCCVVWVCVWCVCVCVCVCVCLL